MSIQSPTGILNVTNATIRAGKVETTDLVVSGGFDMGAISSNADVMVDFGYTRQERKYPREKLEAASQNGYVVTSSTVAASTEASNAFIENAAYGFVSANDAFATSGGSGAATSNYSFNGIDGPWLKLQLANAISLQSFEIYALESASSERISSGYVWASNDDSTWTQVATVDSNSTGATVQVGSNVAYEYFALHVTGVNHANGDVSVGEWKLHGYEATGGDGQDLILKTHVNAPSTDFLEVHYDANVSNSYPGTGTTLTDLSSSHNGVLNNGVGFSASDSALTFDGTNQNVNTQTLGLEGDYVHSVSLWVKPSTHQNALSQTTFSSLFYVGEETAVASQTVSLAYRRDSLRYRFGSNDVYVTSTDFPADVWVHLVAVYRGGGGAPANRDVYVDGVKQTFAGSVTASASLDLQTDAFLRLGAGAGTNAAPSEPFGGSIANFRIHTRPLLEYEVLQLYAYEKVRFGHADTLDFTLTGGRVGLGTAYPGSTLDVRGDAKITSNLEVGARIGIGTSAPGSTLDVRGDANVGALSLTSATFPKTTAAIVSAGEDAVVDLKVAHDRESAVLKKYPEVRFDGRKLQYNTQSNTYTQSGYVVTQSSTSVPGTHDGWRVFDEGDASLTYWHAEGDPYNNPGDDYKNTSPYTQSLGTYAGEWIKLELPKKIKVSSVSLQGRHTDRSFGKWYILGSNDDSTWDVVHHKNTTTDNFSTSMISYVMTGPSKDNYYKYFAILGTHIVGDDTKGSLGKWELYGYEETNTTGDTSLDTTITSKYNTPDLTNASLYLDGLKGSTATDYSGNEVAVTENNVDWDSVEKAWVLSGSATSNIVTADLGFEGDQPHSISAWVKADVLNDDGLFHVGTAEGEGDAASRVGFVDDSHISWGGEDHYFSNAEWHNVTYTYNGKSSEKALYIDGQKVGSGGNEDTFGEYPPFAMMTYSEHGYTVSASSTYTGNSNWSPFEAFNKQVGGTVGHITEGNHYTTADPGTYNGTAANAFLGIRADTGADIVEGDWLKIEMPHKLIASYLRIYSSSDEPDSFKLYGSNDDSVWTELLSVTGNTTINAYLDYPTSTRGAFKYFALVVSKQGSTYTYWRLDEMKIYGHRENDLVRFPDPTNVLSYPHIDMMGRNAPLLNVADLTHAQRGYVVTASSMYVSNARNPYEPWRAFSYYSGYWWASTGLANTYGGGSGAYGTVRSANLGTDSGGSATPENGEWIKIEMPRKITLSSLMIRATSTATAAPKDFKLYGSNDGTSWTEILSETGAVPGTTGTHYTPSSTPSAYKHFGLVVTRSGGRTDYIEIGKLEFYGTEESLDVIARIGDGFEGKVRNFRVYSTALSGDRIKSIFDAEKDEFQRALSSVSVYRGHLGIGTTTPPAALTVMDNVKEMDEFPPSAMTAYETHIEGHGVFEAYGSSDFGATFYRAFNAFDKSVSTVGGNNGWASREYTWVGENTLPETSNCAVFDGVYCEWIALRMPYKVKLKKVSLQARNDGSVPHEMPKRGRIYGSNDRTLWTKIHDYSNLPAFTEGSTYYFDVNTSEYYKHILLTADERYSASSGSPRWVAIGEIRYFGTREHGASTLDDGELKLTRNLTVPRIGPALNEYDVPQRHRLHIEYDTSLPIHADLPIDTSGNSRDGAYGGSGVYYSYPEKAFHYDGTNQLTGTTAFVEGDNTFTFSMWVKMTKKDSTDCFIYFGDSATGAGIGVDIYSNGQFYWYTYSGNYLLWYGVAGDWFPLNTWTHLAITHYVTRTWDGLGFNDRNRVYINGVYQTPDFVRDDGNTYDPYFDANDTFCLGARNNSYHLNGAISNFQLWWDVVLSPEEIWQTYKRGRVPEKHHLQIADSTVTIGGHNRDRNVQLDVAGHIRAGGQEIHTFTGQHRCFPSEPVEQGLIVSADKNQFVKMNKGLATGSKAITIDESLPVVSLSNVAQDKRCFGVVSSLEKSNTVTRREVTNGIVSEQKKELGDNRAIVNSVGEGAIWVCDAGGPLDSGDYITTSNVPGYGMAQSDDLLHNYTVAKITMDCDFTASNVAVRTIKKEMTGLKTITEDVWNTLVEYDRDSNSVTQYSNTLSVEAWSNLAAEDASGYDPTTVTTTVDYTDGRSNLISIEEWSNLAPGEQILYSANTHTEIVDYTKFISTDEWSNLTPDVQGTFAETEVVTYYRKEWGQNVLDERGNLIWEEKTGEFEQPYKFRFLDATGAQTDEANCVYRAAFVGCTYHCG